MRDKQQSNSGAAPTTVSEELLRCSYVIFWRFGDGQHAQFNPSAGSCDAPGSPLLSAGGFPLSVSASRLCHSAAAAPSRLPLSVSLLPERPGALVPPALQWRLSGPGAL